jgi:hypothetical protein
VNHIIDRTKPGKFKLGRRTDRKRRNARLKEMAEWLKEARNTLKLKELWKTLRAKLAGHFRYYGVSGNYRGIAMFHTVTLRLVMKWLNRRSQKKSFNGETFCAKLS